MINSMTGFGSRECQVAPFGKICVELRSTNHKFLEIVLHLPQGFLSLEDKIKKEIEARIKRGRVVCAVNIVGAEAPRVFVHEKLLKNYLAALKTIQQQFRIKDEPSLDALMNLPGVLAPVESNLSKEAIWLHLKKLLKRAAEDLAKARQKEGAVLVSGLKTKAQTLRRHLEIINTRFKKVIQAKSASISIEEERVAFLKDADIAEESERLAFHIQNFISKLGKSSPLGKELDIIAQEMQRETNTIGAKSCDALISGRVVQLKSQIEQIREQVQNIE